jgi:AcrR family transcriptional regulator
MTITSDAETTQSTGDRLVSAALEAFSTGGFEGTSARQIERLAGVERGLVGYHFGSKQELWNRAVDQLFNRYTDELESLRQALRDVSRRERASAMLKAYARFNARYPQFFRILIIEGHSKTERAERLARHLRHALRVFNDVTELSEPIPVATAIRWFQVIGAAGTLFSLSALADLTFGTRTQDPDFTDAFAAGLAAIALEASAHDEATAPEYVRFLGGLADGDAGQDPK